MTENIPNILSMVKRERLAFPKPNGGAQVVLYLLRGNMYNMYEYCSQSGGEGNEELLGPLFMTEGWVSGPSEGEVGGWSIILIIYNTGI